MKKLFTTFAVLSTLSVGAQTTSNFETLTLAPESVWTATDSSEQGFNDGNVYFPSNWDTSFGGFWSGGFAYSNQTDSVNSSYLNAFSAKTASGYDGSSTYAVINGSSYFRLSGAARGKQVNGAYFTNSTYAYNTLRDGNAFSKKFGGESGNDPDYFRVKFFGHNQGSHSGDTILFYLADFRNSDNSQDYTIKNWTWVDFTSLGNVDSVGFLFESTDVGMFGMNTPAYFCIDNLVTADSPSGFQASNAKPETPIYPNPAGESVTINSEKHTHTVQFVDINGRIAKSFRPNSKRSIVQTNDLESGIYTVQHLSNTGIFAEKLIISHP